MHRPQLSDVSRKFPINSVRVMSLIDQMRASTAADRRTINVALAMLHAAMALWGLCLDSTPIALVGIGAQWVPRTYNVTNAGNYSLAACSNPATGNDGVTICQVFTEPLVFNSFDIAQLATLFFVVTAGAHTYYAWQQPVYEQMIATQLNWWRWVEYSLSVPPMLIIIAMLNGLSEESGLVQGAILGAVTQAFGYIADKLALSCPECRSAIAVHATGYVPMIAAFAPVIRGIVVLATDDTVEPPSFVPFVIASQTLLFSSFGFVQLWYLTLSARQPNDYIVCEMIYLLLSLVCKASLGGSILAAVSFFGDTPA